MMSGLEIVGVVLGALPLAIQAVKAYEDIFSFFENAARELKNLRQDLRTEQYRLKTTCEYLLGGFIPLNAQSTIDSLIDQPFSKKWRRYDKELQQRLWSDRSAFLEWMGEFQQSVEELNRMLGIDRNGEMRAKDTKGLINLLKQGFIFTFKKGQYEQLLSRIKKSNSELETMTRSCLELEPPRRRRSQSALTRIIREATSSMFQAMSNVTITPFASTHSVCLELEPRDDLVLPGCENQVKSQLLFHISLKSTCLNRPLWKDLHVNPLGNPDDQGSKASIARLSPGELRISFAQAQNVKYNTSRSSMTQTFLEEPKLSDHFAKIDSQSSAKAIRDLCNAVCGNPKQQAVECYGSIVDSSCKFRVLHAPDQMDVEKAFTLREILEIQTHNGHEWLFPQRLETAIAISTGVLHLFSTPWVPKLLTLDDFIFMQESDSFQCLPKAFVANSMLQCSPGGSSVGMDIGIIQAKAPMSSQRQIHRTVLSLGAILLQLIIGRRVEELEGAKLESINSMLSAYKAKQKYIGQALENGTENFANAIEWCFQSVSNISGLEDPEFCQKFYENVVSRLEDDAKAIRRL